MKPRLILLATGVAVVMLLAALLLRAHGNENRIALASEPKGVTAVTATPGEYRAQYRYVGKVEPWLYARVGPQLVSAYVDTLLVRPGDQVARGAMLATLDCKRTSSTSAAVAAQAQALQERQHAYAAEVTRIEQMSQDGFVAPNTLEQKQANARATQAQVDALRAQLAGKSLEVQDCTLRAPFAGEIGERLLDPGAFVRPGATMLTVIDRHLVRVVADAPEVDVNGLKEHTPVTVRLIANGTTMPAVISRLAPSADPLTRTVHFEIDLDPQLVAVPVGTSAEIRVAVGDAVAATMIPLTAAKVRGDVATVFVVERDVVRAQTVKVLGERGGSLYLEPTLAPGTQVVKEGRNTLSDGDQVIAKVDAP